MRNNNKKDSRQLKLMVLGEGSMARPSAAGVSLFASETKALDES